MVLGKLRCLFFTCCWLAALCLMERGEAGGFYTSLGWGESVADFGSDHLRIGDALVGMMRPRRWEQNVIRYGRNAFAGGLGGVGIGEFGDKYRPVYLDEFGLSGSFGYSFGDFNVEVQGSRREFRADTTGYKIKDNAIHFAFERKEGAEKEVFIGENAGVYVGSVVLDACYSGLRVSGKSGMYSCLGLGLAAVDYLGGFGKLKAVWGAKIGIELQIAKNLAMFSEVYYRGFGVLPGKTRVFSSSAIDGIDATLSSRMHISYVGNVCGIKYLF